MLTIQNEVLNFILSDSFPIGVLLPLTRISKRHIIQDKPVFRYTPAQLDPLKETLNTTSCNFVLSE